MLPVRRSRRLLATLLATLVAMVAVGLVVIGWPVVAAALPSFGTDPVQDTSSPRGSPIVDVRVGANDGFDRFVVEFEDSVGPYFVSYVDQVAQDGSGAPVPVEGSAFVQVSLNGVPNDPLAPQDSIDAGLTGLIQVVGAGAGFEATVSYGLGTAQAAGFRVFTLTDPSRLVVDIAHPDSVPTASNTLDPTESPTATTPTSPAAQPSAGPTDPDPTTAGASADDGGSNSWLIYLAVGLVLVAIVAGLVGWRLRRSR